MWVSRWIMMKRGAEPISSSVPEDQAEAPSSGPIPSGSICRHPWVFPTPGDLLSPHEEISFGLCPAVPQKNHK